MITTPSMWNKLLYYLAHANIDSMLEMEVGHVVHSDLITTFNFLISKRWKNNISKFRVCNWFARVGWFGLSCGFLRR